MGKTRKIEISAHNRSQRIVLPINPEEVEIFTAQLNQKITLLNFGAANVPGKRELIRIQWSSFFPGQKSPFYHYAKMPPKRYYQRIKGWKDNSEIVRVIITDMGINLAMLIDEFSVTVKEGQRDMEYSITLSEYRTLNVPSVSITKQVKPITGLKERPNTTAPTKTYTVKTGDNLYNIAKRLYGNGNDWKKIFAANGGTIKDANKIYAGQVFTIP